MDVPLIGWLALAGMALVMIAVDLFFFGRRAEDVSTAEAVWWSIGWFALGLAFTGVIWGWQGEEAGVEYLAGFLIERALSIDNIFVFALIFGFFAVPSELRQRLLLWGIVGALVLRIIFIFAGAALLDAVHAVIYVFGAILLYTAWKLATHDGMEVHPDRNPMLRLMRRFVPTTNDWHGSRWWIRVDGRRVATPVLAVFIVVITTDLVFAIDSIPAIFAITTDEFIVVAANVFALLGLRALYFLLEDMMDRFEYLQMGLAVVLGFVGVKMIISDFYKVPIVISLGVIVLVLAVSIGASLWKSRDVATTGPGDADDRS